MAPEILSYRDDYQNKVDVWSLGWTFYEVFLKQDPYPADNVRSMVIFPPQYRKICLMPSATEESHFPAIAISHHTHRKS